MSSKQILKSLQAASICSGLPFTFMLCFMMPSLWYALCEDRRRGFSTPVYGGIFDYMEFVFSFGKSPLPKTMEHTVAFIMNFFFPTAAMFNANKKLGQGTLPNALTSIIATVFFYAWVVMLIYNNDGYWALGWVMYVGFATILSVIRHKTRKAKDLAGNFCEDFFASLFVYPQVIVQITEEVQGEEVRKAQHKE